MSGADGGASAPKMVEAADGVELALHRLDGHRCPAHEALGSSRLITDHGLGHFGPFEAPDVIASDALATVPGQDPAAAHSETKSAR